MKHYQQLSIEEREKIHLGLWQSKSIRQIAFELARSPSTVCRELQRNFPGQRMVYTPRLAQERAQEAIKRRGQRPRLKSELVRNYVKDKLVNEDWSPEQIAGTLPVSNQGWAISYEAIYQYIYSQYTRAGYGHCIGEDLRIYLKRKHKVRKRKKIPFKQEKGIKNRISIDQRPIVVDERIEPGHWEGDSIVSKKSLVGLNTLVERVSGLVRISKISNGTGAETTVAVTNRLKVIPKTMRKSLTVDNGGENASHQQITSSLGMAVYFAHPYHSWERGTNENTNGLIRYYFPKGTDFATISIERIKEVETKLNARPRKRLGYKTPQEVFNNCVALKC
ncbi:MAG: IS30 family transposase [Candidatus Saganbacteria bacterium]|nr:IS30 family transposase [Candidatus Saganbacteria bacterium]